MIFRLNTGKLVNISRHGFNNNTDYYAKIIKVRFNKILPTGEMSDEAILKLLYKSK